MKIIKSQTDLKAIREENKSIALVPTMGALHKGHLKLVEEGLKRADYCLPYIFLNPTQFAAGEDLESYPKTLDADLEKLEKSGAHGVWLPTQKDIYPDGLEITTKSGSVSKLLEGENRPHFFDGVTTVLERMFTFSKPDIVIMGKKDFQQLQVVKQMVRDLKMSIEIVGVETVRDKNGLALSSRNLYLSSDEYNIAIQLNKILRKLAHGDIDEKTASNNLLKVGFDKVDYCAVRNSEDLTKEGNLNRVLAAVWLGRTRLIDNMEVSV
jgi:pantoate--beta-alanine ligase